MNRRNFLQAASWSAFAELAGISPLRSMSALAQSSSPSDYKALICVFLRGGNDSDNMIIPLDPGQFGLYSQARGPLALTQKSLLQLPGVGYGMHSSFANLSVAYAQGHAAMIANVGPLVQPTTKSRLQAGNAIVPDALMSHEGQQQTWESGGCHSGVGTGWAGRAADLLTPAYNAGNLPMVTLLGEATNFGLGFNTAPFMVGNNSKANAFWCSAGNSCVPRNDAAQQLLTFGSGVSMIQADKQIYSEAYKYNQFYSSVLPHASKLKTSFPTSNPLAPALQTITTMIQLRKEIGARRQVFLIDFGGFDTHSAQNDTQAALFQALDQTVGTFIASMQEMGVYNDVTLFTASDFGRTLEFNAALGSDHAWGGHHFVVGGSVKGGALYGTFPNMALDGPDDIDGTGRWLPTTALCQYTATLASWFGVKPQDLPLILPELNNFPGPRPAFL